MANATLITELNIESLIRDSERLRAIQDYLANTKYIVSEDIKILAGVIEDKPTEETTESEVE